MDNPLWTSETFTRGHAWIDLLLLANYEDGYIYVRGHKIEVKRGQIGWSQNRLSKRWSWSRSKVRKFLKDLEQEQQIKQQKSKSYTVITLINYNYYQSPKHQKNNSRTRDFGGNEEKDQKQEQQKEQQEIIANSSHSHYMEGLENQKNNSKNNRKTREEQQQDTNKNVNNVKNSGPPTQKDVENYFSDKGKMLEKDIPLEAEKFINYYADQDWQKSNGKKITNWHRQAGTWQARYQQWNEDRINQSTNDHQSYQQIV